MKKNKIYVTTMYRFQNRESHSYVVYAGFSKHQAIKTGKDENDYRGRKYSPEVLEYTPGKPETKKCVQELNPKSEW